MSGELDQIRKDALLCRGESTGDEEAVEVEEGDGGVADEEGFDARKLGPL